MLPSTLKINSHSPKIPKTPGGHVCVVESCHVTFKTYLDILGNCVNKAACQTGGNNVSHWLLRLGKEQSSPELIDTPVKFI